MIIRRLNHLRKQRMRIGTAAVEAALVLPLLVIVTFGAVDVAQYINLSQLVSNASREGARTASRNTTGSIDEVEASIVNFLADSLPNLPEENLAAAVTIEVLNGVDESVIPGGDLARIVSGDPIYVKVTFDFAKIRWLPGPQYWNNDMQESITFCRRE